MRPVKPVAIARTYGVDLATMSRLLGQRRSLVDETQRGTASLRLWCWRREDNTGCKQSFAYLLPDDIADSIRTGAPRFGMVESSGLRLLR